MGWNTVAGNGRIVSQTRAVSQFNEVSVAGSGELTVSQGSEESLTIETDENLLPLVKSEVSGGHLRIGPKDVNLRPTKGIRYQLKLKNLNALRLSGSVNAGLGPIKTENLAFQVSGSGRIQSAQLQAKDLSAHISGSGRIQAAQLEVKQLSVQISGSGDTDVAGEAERQDIHISGSGSHQASQLKCSQADAQISGSGHATLLVKDSLSAHISGSGEIEYYGSPQVNSHVSGSGHVRSLGNK
jgi:carbon monoxide dehydrogenase subunit G